MAGSVEAISDRVQQFLQDASLYSIAHVVPSLLSLAALMLFTRVFPPDMFGRYSLSLAVVGISATLLYGWLTYSVLRYAPQMDETLVIRNTFTLYLGLSFGFLLVAAAGYYLFGRYLGPYGVFYLAAATLVPARGCFQPLVAYYRATLNSKKVTLFRLTRAVVALAAAVVLALFLFDHIVGWIWGATLGILVTVSFVFLTSSELRRPPLAQRDMMGRLFRYGVPMIGFIVGDTILTQADRVLLEFLAGSASVGIYSANYMLVDRGLRLAYTPLLQAINPIIIDSWEKDNEQEISEMLREFTRYFILLGTPALVLVGVLGKTVSSLLLGDQFQGGFIIIPVVAVGLFMWSLANLGQVVVEIKEQTSFLSLGVAGIVALNLALNVPLIGALGYLGAAVATTASYASYFVFVGWLTSKYIPWEFPVVCLGRALVGGALMAVPTLALFAFDRYSLVGSVATAALGVLVYLVVIYLLGEIEQNDVAKLRQFLR